jgi:putative heme transporter
VSDGRRIQPELARVPSWLATLTAWTWRLLVLLVGASVLVVVATQLALVTVPIIVALILATLAVPPARLLERAGAPPAVAAFVVVVGGLALVGGGIAALVPSFLEQVRELGPTVRDGLGRILDWVETGPLGIDRDELTDFGSQVIEGLQAQGGAVASGALSLVASVVEGIAALTLALILLFFFIKDGDRIWAWIVERTSPTHRPSVIALGQRSWEALAGYVRGTALVALIDAVGIGIGLAIVGVPLVLPLAVLVFIGGFVPIVGAFVTGLLAVAVALADGGATQALIVLAIVVVVQQVESDILQPVIMRRAVPLHPVVVLAVLTAGAKLVGIVGAFLAVPIAAVVSAVGNELRLRHELATGEIPVEADVHALGGRQGLIDDHEGPADDGPGDDGPGDDGPGDDGPGGQPSSRA